MYSLILATMVTVGAESPSNWYGCHGCYGCVGYNAFSGGYGGCYGCYGGCYGSCWGSCHGCWGSCYGGCWGSCYGWGCVGYSSCYGCTGCVGYYGWGGYYYGCAGCTGCVGSVIVVPAKPVLKGEAVPGAPNILGDEAKRPAATPASVTIVLPEGARLYVNDQPIAVNPAARTFQTPELQPGQTYHYIFRAEVPRDGQMVRDVQRVEVAAGRQVTVEFKGLPNAAARR